MFKIIKKDKNTKARVGLLETKHGVVHTPAYVIVGTRAAVKTLSSEDLLRTKTQLVIVNTYHMWMELGDEGLNKFPGLHEHMNWDKALMTDSGGFQVFSLRFPRREGIGKVFRGHEKKELLLTEKDTVKITEDGIFFKAGGKEHYLDAEKSIKIQEQLGADIIFVLDECTSSLHDYDYTKMAMERTHRWAKRSLKARTSDQLLFGIVQGGLFEDLRKQSAKFIAALDFDGFGIGGAFGKSLGEWNNEPFEELEWTLPLLPESKPRHLLGVGRPADLFKAVASGIDTFDCVVPTREGRHGSVWTSEGRFDLQQGKYRDDKHVIDEMCGCLVCSEKKLPRGEIRRLFKEKSPEAGRFASLHNVYFFNDLMDKIRHAIREGQFLELWEQYKRV